jgi:hypothetical protein
MEKSVLEQKIADIYTSYCSCKEDSMQSRRQTLLARMCTEVFKWCTDYPFYFFDKLGCAKTVDAKEMGLEIFTAVTNCAKIYAEKSFAEFFCILIHALQNAWSEYCRKYEAEIIYIPRGTKEKNKKPVGGKNA